MVKKFYDTCAILADCFSLENVVISSKSIEELENIKTSTNKTEDIKFAARAAVRVIKDSNVEVVVVTTECYDILAAHGLEITNDNLIIASARIYANNSKNDVIFVTNDLLCGLIAEKYFHLKVESNEKQKDIYKGYKIIHPQDELLAKVYDKDNTENVFDCLTNEYVVIKDENNETRDIFKWIGNRYVTLVNKVLKSMAFGDKIKPKDDYQRMVVDSLLTNTITAISGHAGSGKSLLCLMAAMYLIESGKYDRLVILFNPCPVRGAAQLGYYSGDLIEKTMQGNIGNILTTKFGERYAVDNMINNGKLKLVPMSDCRGMEIRDNEILYITEAENTSADLMKLCLSRASSGAKIFIEGDYDQTDSRLFEANNGLRRAVEVLKGSELFGFVELQNVFRSKIAALVDKM